MTYECCGDKRPVLVERDAKGRITRYVHCDGEGPVARGSASFYPLLMGESFEIDRETFDSTWEGAV
jgi:hypothetical protein